MDTMPMLKREIEKLREHLNQAVISLEFTTEEIQGISQELDVLLLQYYQHPECRE
ncbi:MAG TPA: aspartyl-phosphate phosphatase Spo0E family protein [Clostridia bacterium]|nr:aspartyl-phosphate phosphatase Spo0E family protein [Clostridia bacterium]